MSVKRVATGCMALVAGAVLMWLLVGEKVLKVIEPNPELIVVASLDGGTDYIDYEDTWCSEVEAINLDPMTPGSQSVEEFWNGKIIAFPTKRDLEDFVADGLPPEKEFTDAGELIDGEPIVASIVTTEMFDREPEFIEFAELCVPWADARVESAIFELYVAGRVMVTARPLPIDDEHGPFPWERLEQGVLLGVAYAPDRGAVVAEVY